MKQKPIKLTKETDVKKMILILTQDKNDVIVTHMIKDKKTGLKRSYEEIEFDILVGQLANRLNLRGWERV